MREVSYHPEADAEVIASARYYNMQESSLGARFLDSLDCAIEIIQSDPERWREVEDGVHRYMMQDFPFQIFYLIHRERIRVLAVYHSSRRPGAWRSRLAG